MVAGEQCAHSIVSRSIPESSSLSSASSCDGAVSPPCFGAGRAACADDRSSSSDGCLRFSDDDAAVAENPPLVPDDIVEVSIFGFSYFRLAVRNLILNEVGECRSRQSE